MWYHNLLAGIGAGIVYGMSNYMKSYEPDVSGVPLEEFDWHLFARTLLIGLVLGIIAQAMGVSIYSLESTAVVGFLTMLIDNGLKMISRRIDQGRL